jgi:carbon monoxide dehydrogenase subunit G
VRFNGSAEFVAERREVWQVLIDPTRVGPCLPIPITRIDETHFRSQTTIGSGLFSAVFKMQVELIVGDPEQLARLVAHGQGSGTTVDATTSFALSEGSTAGTTVVDWTADVELGGMFAAMGTKLIEQRAPEAIRSLIECLHRQIED